MARPLTPAEVKSLKPNDLVKVQIDVGAKVWIIPGKVLGLWTPARGTPHTYARVEVNGAVILAFTSTGACCTEGFGKLTMLMSAD